MRKYISDHWIKSFMIMIGIGLFGVSAGVLQSCDDDDEIQNKPTLYIVTEDIEALSTYGGTIPVEFLCNLDWQVSTDATWITLDTKACLLYTSPSPRD